MAKAKKTATVEEMQGEINALQQLLRGSDYKALKYSEGFIPEDEYAETKAQRQGYRDRINVLQEEIQAAEQQE